ncbi:hypothetical protein F8388_011120 [Cannabis sativa]|uniref:DUF4283 domain-containing protein n=1 Tax=Cannabis sativa TaxID=3483 RepID=A0A7J6E6H3_CANSA|nr:hypothetical protein F8388_011120 [Cannabis sativa]
MGRVQLTISGDNFLDFASISLVFLGLGCDFLGWWGIILRFSGFFNEFLRGGVQSIEIAVFSLVSGVIIFFSLGLAAIFLALQRVVFVLIVFSLIVPMDLELVNSLAEVLVLDEGDGPVLALNQAGVEEGKKRMDLCLVGKMIGPKPVNKEGIERAMKGIWRINNQFQVEELSSKNVFCFFFGSREDRQQVQRNRENSPSNRPIMTMGEASRIVSAVEKNRARYSGPTPEELAPTSVLEAREREEELASHDSDVHNIAVAPMGNVPNEVNLVGLQQNNSMGRDKSLNSTSSDMDSVAEMVIPVDCGKKVTVGEGDNGKVNASTSVTVDLVNEVEFGEGSNQKLTKEQKGKGVLAHSSHDELSFSHALQHTFEPLIKAQKAKTWKRITSSSSRGSKGVSKLSAFSISPKLSHVMVANAKYKLSPKVNGGGKQKMDVEGATEKCHDIVNQTWLEPDVPLDSQDNILDIFGRCAERLGEWNKDKFGSIPRRVRETQKQLDDLLSVAAPLYFGTIFSSASPSVQQVENGITSIEARVTSEECDMLVMFGRKTRNYTRADFVTCRNTNHYIIELSDKNKNKTKRDKKSEAKSVQWTERP